jgi:hypothetical protein
LDGRFEKLTVDDPRDVVNKPMMKTKMKMPEMVAAKRNRGGLTGMLLCALLIHTYIVVSRERERERLSVYQSYVVMPPPQVYGSAIFAPRVAQRRGRRGCVQCAYS